MIFLRRRRNRSRKGKVGEVVMLALSRKKDEAIVINNNIEITILEVKGDHVKIGISAPKSVPVYRKDPPLQIQESNKEATNLENVEVLKNLLG